MTLKDRERNRRKKEIMKVASRLFAQKGYSNTTMADISKATGFSIGLLYEMFEGKEQLYIMVHQEKITKLAEQLRKVTASGTPTEKLEKFIETYASFFVKERDFFRIFAQEHMTFGKRRGTLLREQIRPVIREFFHLVRSIIKEGEKKGEFNVPSPDVGGSLVMGGIHATLGLWITGEIKEKPQILKRQLKSLLMKAVRR